MFSVYSLRSNGVITVASVAFDTVTPRACDDALWPTMERGTKPNVARARAISILQLGGPVPPPPTQLEHFAAGGSPRRTVLRLGACEQGV